MSRCLTSISDWFPADPIITHKRAMIYSLWKTEFDDNYLINDVEWLFVRTLYIVFGIMIRRNQELYCFVSKRGVKRPINDALMLYHIGYGGVGVKDPALMMMSNDLRNTMAALL